MAFVSPQQRRGRISSNSCFWTFRLMTYFVLAAATYIFADIALKGSRTIFQTQRRLSLTSTS